MNDVSASSPAPKPYRRWFAEILVIVMSILLAFGIEAWWDERQERLEEQEILAGLEREFMNYQSKLDRAIERHAEMLAAMEQLLEATESGRWRSDALTLDQAILRSLWPPTTELGGGVRDALVQAGRLELISDRRLREKLALWPGVYAEILDDETFSRDLVFSKLVTHLTDNGYDLSAAVEGLSSYSGAEGGLGADEEETRRLLEDRTYRALIQFRLGFWRHAEQEYLRGRAAVGEILGLIAESQTP